MKEKNSTIPINQEEIASYLKDVRRLKVMTPERERELADRMLSGFLTETEVGEIKKELLEGNLRFVITVAKQYQNQGLDLPDLIAEGNYGLLKAIENFDWSKRLRFISYGVWWVRQSIMQSVYENGNTVRLPINKINNIGKINKASDKLYQSLDREPTIEELVGVTELTEKEVKISVNDIMGYVSIDDKIRQDSDSEVGDFIPGETMDDIDKKINISSLKQEINSVFEDLSEREIRILNMHFGLNGYHEMSLKEIGEELSLTNERVRQIKEFSLKKLRMYGKSSKLKEFLDCKL